MGHKWVVCWTLTLFWLWIFTGTKGSQDPERLPVLLMHTVSNSDHLRPDNVTIILFDPEEKNILWKDTFLTYANDIHVGANAHKNIICWKHYNTTTLLKCLRDNVTLPSPPFELPRRSMDGFEAFVLINFNPLGDHIVWQEPSGGGIFLTNIETQASIPLLPEEQERIGGFRLLDMDWINGVLFGVPYFNSVMVTMVTLKENGSYTETNWQSLDGNSIWGIASHSELQTIYWVTWKYLYVKSYYRDDAKHLSQDFDWIPVQNSFHYHGSHLYWLEGAEDKFKVLKTWRISDGVEIETKIGFVGERISSCAAFEDDAPSAVSACAELGCSHICRVYYQGKSECACPWGLVLQDKTNCVGKSVAAVAVQGDSANMGQLFVREMADIGFNISRVIVPELNISDVGAIAPDYENTGYCFVEKSSLKMICPESEKRNPAKRPPSLHISSAASREVLFMEMVEDHNYYLWLSNSSGCLERYDSKLNESWTLTCVPALKLQVTAVDSVNWIIFWSDSSQIFKTQVWSNLTSLFAALGTGPRNTGGAGLSMAVDSDSEKLYWINGSLRCSGYDGAESRKIYNLEKSARNLVYSAKGLYWIENCEDSNCIFIFDVERLTREKLFNGRPGQVFQFLVAQSQLNARTNSSCAHNKCSHFCAPVPSGRDPFTCWCPWERPFLSKRRDCKVPNFVVASYITNSSDAEIAFNYDGLSTFPVTLHNVTASNVKLAVSRAAKRVCYTQEADGSIIECAQSSGEAGKYIGMEPTSNLRFLVFNTAGDEKYWAGGSSTLCLFIGKMTSNKSMQIVCSASVYDVNSLVIDTAGKILFWCDSKSIIRYSSLLLLNIGINVYNLLSWHPPDSENSNCTGLAVDTFRGGVFVIVGQYIISVPYKDLRTNKNWTAIHFNNYKYATELQFHSGYLFWIGGESGGGEFIDMLRLPHYYGSASPVFSSWNSRRIYTAGPPSGGRIFLLGMYEQVLEDYNWTNECTNPNLCTDFCFSFDENLIQHDYECFCPPHNSSTPEESMCSTGFVWSANLISMILGSVICIFTVIVLLGFWIIKKSSTRRIEVDFRSDVNSFFNGNPGPGTPSRNQAFSKLTPSIPPFTSIIPPSDIKIDHTDILGDGNFGIVYKAVFRGEPVAAKTFKPGITKDLLADFMREVKVMAFVGNHENIVEFFGAETSRILEGILYVVVEFSPLGSLDRLLRTNSKTIRDSASAVDIYQYQNTKLGTWSLISWSAQIARGMQFLEEKHVVHGDLATRNVLVFDSCQRVKISDFGFARNLYQNPIYRKSVQCPLPFRWSSIETLHHFEFSTKADVWSYGVTVWEIFELGGTPYAQRGWDQDFIKDLLNGERLAKPELASQIMYDKIMKPCWQNEPGDRPSFKEIVQVFDDIEKRFSECRL